MRLTVRLKLLADSNQKSILEETIGRLNRAANKMSQFAWASKEFGRFHIQSGCYKLIRSTLGISAQSTCLVAAKVANAYKKDTRKLRVFRKYGAVSYDKRVLSINIHTSTVSIWTTGGRLRIPFAGGERAIRLLSSRHHESVLVKDGKEIFLHVSVESEEADCICASDCLGVDMGIAVIAHDSDGNAYRSSELTEFRRKNRWLIRKLKRKNTKSSIRLARKRGRRESNFAKNINHKISRSIVQNAKRTNRAIAIENLTGIRTRDRSKRRDGRDLYAWAFAQLGCLISYKAIRCGVPVFRVDARNTSIQCSRCGHTDKKNRLSQSDFLCGKCGQIDNADGNAARNIRLKGLNVLGMGASATRTRKVVNPRPATHRKSDRELNLILNPELASSRPPIEDIC